MSRWDVNTWDTQEDTPASATKERVAVANGVLWEGTVATVDSLSLLLETGCGDSAELTLAGGPLSTTLAATEAGVFSIPGAWAVDGVLTLSASGVTEPGWVTLFYRDTL